ncbi:BatD family protein [Paraflavitalea pollutisoli]|uniref:BatD family protein n=1 Tax=Paraflavitalea pollutisoli TaxID=3034143 RepID=UPI0023EB513E|nr:BatD family protein [Paraflavitalea sp. H1-2-19X]
MGWQFASGQVKFYTQLNESTVQFPQTFQVQYVIEGAKSVQDFRVPEFSDFRVDGTFDYQNTTSIQAQTRQLLESYVKIVILSPRRTGKFTIPGAVAIVDGKKMTSTAVKVVVQRTGLSTAGAPRAEEEVDMESATELQPGEDVTEEIHRNFFLRTEVNKKDCYVGEPVMAVYKAYSRLSTTAQVTKRPSLNGFSVIEMVDGYDNKQEIEVYKGKAYYVNVIRKVQLIPLQEGSFSLDPAEVEGMVHFRKKDLQSGSWTAADYPVSVKSDPVEMTIRPLPVENQPEHYTGAVGKFDIAVKAPAGPIRQGDLVKIQVVISGTGNLNLITAPVVQWPRGVDTADPAVRENVNKYIYPLTGSKEFEYSFAAPDTGTCTVPAIELAYYDPYLKEYKFSSSQPVTMQIMPGVSKAEQQERNDVLERANERGIPRHLYFFGAVVLAIASWIFYQSWQLRRSRKTAKPLVPAPKPVEVALTVVSPEQRLATAREALHNNDKRLFCQEIQQVLWKAIGEKCQVAPSAMNKQHIAGALAERGVPAETVQQLIRVLNECEWALYTPGEQVDDMKRIFYETKDLLQQLQQV